jgi:hypothetical protein
LNAARVSINSLFFLAVLSLSLTSYTFCLANSTFFSARFTFYKALFLAAFLFSCYLCFLREDFTRFLISASVVGFFFSYLAD